MNIPERPENVRAVGRALEILLAFAPQDAELSAGELLKRVDLSRPTLYRLIYTLEEFGFLVSAGDPQRFRLGPSVARLAHAWASSFNLATLAQPSLHRLWEATGETIAMFVPQRELRLCVSELPSMNPLSFRRGIGYTEWIARGASGRAILAHMEVTAHELESYAAGAGVDYKSLVAELARTRNLGWASSRNELISGAVGIATPFFDCNGAVAGSIGIFGPEIRLPEARYLELARLLEGEAKLLSAALGHRYERNCRPRIHP